MATEAEKTYRLRDINLRIRPNDPIYVAVHRGARAKGMTATQYIRWLITKDDIVRSKDNEVPVTFNSR